MLVNIRSLSVSHSGSNFCISFLCCIPQLRINEWLMFSVSDNFFSYSWRSTSATCTVPTDFSNIKRILKHISNIASFPALSSSCAITQVVNGRCDFCHRYMFDCEHVKASLNHRTIVFVDLRDSIGTFFFCISAWYICVVTAGKSLLCHATTNFTGKPDRVVFVHPFEDTLHKRVVGQDEAVRVVSEAIQRSRAGIQDPNRPLGSFLFLGPTGVGKTELAKTLAEALFDDEKNLVRIDMSEYMEKFSVSRLIGAPPGYVGYEEGGQLTEAVRRRPYSVILFDEIEKAHPDVFNILLQVLDDGRITDSQGRTVDFKNTIIILTTNLGTRDIAKAANTGFNLGTNTESSYQRMKEQVSAELKQQFRPEFLNRLDDIIVFKQLTEPQVRQIVDLDVKQLNDRLFDRHMSLELTDAAKDLLAQKGFDPLLGARPLRRVIQRDIEDAISEKILMGDLEDGQRVKVDAEGEGILGEFTFTGEAFEEPNQKDNPAEATETAAETDAATEPTASTEPADSAQSQN